MFEISASKIQSVIVHLVGNKLKEESLVFSEELSGMDQATENVIWTYLMSAFKSPDFYKFHHPVDLEFNAVYQIIKDTFKDEESFKRKSCDLAKLLYDVSDHPQIKAGEFFVILFKDLAFDKISGDAIGIFKSERKQAFLFTEESNSVIDLFTYNGISPSKVDKACLVFHDSQEDGFNVLSVDNVNKGDDAKFWFEEFLKIKPRSTDFSKTDKVLSLAKDFIEMDLGGEKQLEKPESIDLLNKSINYFKENESFNIQEFKDQIFEDEKIAEKFLEFSDERSVPEISINESFTISVPAVKKKNKFFKSVLKLDKNFHVYIHGDRELVEKGVDENGKKYYKLYYEEES
tara:strand:+ start:23 stop:1060 length:1038 start_codon:yes stop_codon:yes gene_type:complete